MKRVSIVGLGYIGLPTAIVAAEAGFDVCGFDTDKEKIEAINAGTTTILEPEIHERLWSVIKNKNFKAYYDLQFADYFLIAVPTPVKLSKKVDLDAIHHAIENVAKRLRRGNVVIIESTIPVGTTAQLTTILEDLSGLKAKLDFFVSHCPERVLPGRIFTEVVENDRVVGGICQSSCEKTIAFYNKFVKGFMHITDDKTAEMIKLVENSSRDCQIAFANEVAAMAQEAGLDPYHIIELANRHPRVKILSPSCGVGGHCIAVDPWFLIESFPQSTRLLKTAREINDHKPHTIIAQVLSQAEEFTLETGKKPKILCLGLTFKPNIDDIRESPALFITRELVKHESLIECLIYDQNVIATRTPDLEKYYTTSLWDGLCSADIVLILVKHKEFELLGEEAFANKLVIDTCGLLYDISLKNSKNRLKGAVKLAQLGRSNA